MKASAILAAAAIVLAPSLANADLFSPEDTIRDIISKFQAALEAVVRTAGSEARVTGTHYYQLSTAIIDNLETTYADSLDLTFKQISAERQKTFTQAEDFIQDLVDNVPFDELQRSADIAREVIATAIPWSDAPLVMNYSPKFVSPRESDDLVVTIWGSRLHGDGYKGHHLLINGHEITANMTQNGALSFVVPRKQLPFSQRSAQFLQATLRITQEPGGLNPWAEDDKTDFNLLFTVLPESLGTLEVRRVIEVRDREVVKFKSKTIAAETHRGGWVETRECVHAPEGYRYDLSTLEMKKDRHAAYKDNDTSPGTNVASWNINLSTPLQICFSVVASVGCKECGGWTEGHIEVDQVRETSRREVINEQPIPIRWGQDMHIDLDRNATSQIATLKMFDDISRVVSLTQRSEPVFLVIDPDLDNEIVFVRPALPWRDGVN
ncbi:hypothetical protein ACFFII_00065 [Paracoccus niistensis]|uniref:Uncharacterized protein n=2 Tax=Paracoccus niistensis TaxID=632935 RepID=A0ABV6HZP2_9RHOB